MGRKADLGTIEPKGAPVNYIMIINYIIRIFRLIEHQIVIAMGWFEQDRE